MSLASDVALGHEIAAYLAGTGRPLTVETIARALKRNQAEVHDVLLRDVRFEPRSMWNLLVEPEERDSGEKTRTTIGDEVGSPPAPRADSPQSSGARGGSASPAAVAPERPGFEPVAVHDPLGMLHSVDWRRYGT